MLIMSEYYIRKTESLIFILEKLSTKTKFPMKFSGKSFPNKKKKKIENFISMLKMHHDKCNF